MKSSSWTGRALERTAESATFVALSRRECGDWTRVLVGAVTARGFWLRLEAKDVFVAYRAFPWFREFTLRELAGVRRPAAQHLRWPEFDIDLELDAIEHPGKYQLVEKRLRGEPARVVERLRSERKRFRNARVS